MGISSRDREAEGVIQSLLKLIEMFLLIYIRFWIRSCVSVVLSPVWEGGN